MDMCPSPGSRCAVTPGMCRASDWPWAKGHHQVLALAGRVELLDVGFAHAGREVQVVGGVRPDTRDNGDGGDTLGQPGRDGQRVRTAA